MASGRATMAVVVVGLLLPAGPAAAQAPSVEPRCEQAAAGIPEFGGAYVEDRVLHVWLTEQDAGLIDAVVAVLREHCPAYDEVVVRVADYSYAELAEWKLQAFALPEVNMTGVDTRTNRLTVGVSDPGPAVMAALADLGIPPDAVDLVEASSARTLPITSYSRVMWVVGVAAVLVVGAATLLVRRRRHRRT